MRCAVILVSLLLAAPSAARVLHDQDVVVDSTWVAGAPATVWLAARAASSLVDSAPLSAGVELELGREGTAETWPLAAMQTDETGELAVSFRVPRVPPGSYALGVRSWSEVGEARASFRVRVVEQNVVHLRTDRGLYRAGEAIRWRVALVSAVDAHPVAGASVALAIRDPRGTEVWRGVVDTDSLGMGGGSLPLADDLLYGRYAVVATHAGVEVSQEVQVRAIELPAFTVSVEAESAPDGPARFVVAARYPYGEPVQGEASLTLSEGSAVLEDVTVSLDVSGQAELVRALSGGAGRTWTLEAAVTDGAGRTHRGQGRLEVGRAPLAVAVVAERATLAPGAEQFITVVTTRGGHTLEPAVVSVEIDGDAQARSLASPGAIRVPMALPSVRTATRRSTRVRALDGDRTGLSSLVPRIEATGGCFERVEPTIRPLRVSLVLERQEGGAWRVDDAVATPFLERRDLPVALGREVRQCVQASLGWVWSGDAPFGQPLELDLEVTTLEEDVSEPVREVIVRVGATADDGSVAAEVVRIPVAGATQDVAWVRADAVVIEPGAPIDVRAHVAGNAGPPLLALLREGVPVATAVGRADASGIFRATLAAPAGVHGLATVRVVGARWSFEHPDVGLLQAQASVYLMPEPLEIAVAGTGRLRPGETRSLAVQVRDRSGRAVPDAGIAASVVDERILALSGPQAPLLDILTARGVDDAEAAGLAFVDLLRRPDRGPAEDALMRAIVEALPPDVQTPEVRLTAPARIHAERERAYRAHTDALGAFVAWEGAVVDRAEHGDAAFRYTAIDALARAGWQGDALETPWGDPLSWEWLASLDEAISPSRMAEDVTRLRLEGAAAALERRGKRVARWLRARRATALTALDGKGWIDPAQLTDAWGAPFEILLAPPSEGGITLRSAGPDGVAGTADDIAHYDVFAEGLAFYGSGMGYGGSGSGFGSRSHRSVSLMGAVAGVSGGSERLGPVEVAVRKRFDETVLWLSGARTGEDGAVELTVPLADSVTGWRVEVEAIGPGGGVGVTTARLETFLAHHVDARLPAQLTVGDLIEVPLVVSNHGELHLSTDLAVIASGALAVEGDASARLEVAAGATAAARVWLRAKEAGAGTVRVEGRNRGNAEPFDIVERSLPVEPQGALVHALRTEALGASGGTLAMTVPDSAVASSVRGRLRVLRGAADHALDGLEGMLREPHGCFEQTSSATFPNLLVLQLLGDRPEMAEARAKAHDLVGRGYQKLLSFEVSGGGFSWFGDAPANLVLTAYGLVEFVEMAKVYPVDDQLIARTRRWILDRQRTDGSWAPDASWLHDWSAVQGRVSTTAWIAWAIAQTGFEGKPLDRALAFLRANRRELAESPYLLALWAAAEGRAGGDPAWALAQLEASRSPAETGLAYLSRGSTLLYGQGQSAEVEVSALAAEALWLAGRRGDAGQVGAWLASAKSASYGWGTTQATVQALRALALAQAPGDPPEGTARLRIGAAEVGEVALGGAEIPTFELASHLRPGVSTLELDSEALEGMLAEVRASWRLADAPRPRDDGLAVHVDVPAEPVQVGGQGAFRVALRNTTPDRIPMPTAVVPVPPGWKAVGGSLDALRDAGHIARWDDMGTELHLYLHRLDPGQTVLLAYALEAESACEVTQRAARAYAYYAPEVGGMSGNASVRAVR
jgi:hypothetical protein